VAAGLRILGEGFATEGAFASVRYGLEELGSRAFISSIQPENAASCRVAEKAGLTLQGNTDWRGNEVVRYAVGHDAWEAEKLTRRDAGRLTNSVLRRGPGGFPL
jgi:RimJ/RimL family protein N-acetyltransferase